MHLFFVHSPITYFVSKQVIRYKKLSRKEVGFITDRRFKLNVLNAFVFDVSDYHFEISWKASDQKKNKSNFLQLKSDFQSWYNKEFELYIPHFSILKAQVLYVLSACKKVHIIEEGTASFRPKSFLRDTSPFANPFHAKLWQVKLKYASKNLLRAKPFVDESESKLGHLYSIHPIAFQDYEKRIVVPIQKTENPELALFNGSYIYIFSNLANSIPLEKRDYYSGLHRTWQRLVEMGVRQIYYKFHPSQLADPEQINTITKGFEPFTSQLIFKELDLSISLEELVFSSKPILITVASSVAIYANLVGVPVWSNALFFMDIPKFSKFWSLLPKINKEAMTYL